MISPGVLLSHIKTKMKNGCYLCIQQRSKKLKECRPLKMLLNPCKLPIKIPFSLHGKKAQDLGLLLCIFYANSISFYSVSLQSLGSVLSPRDESIINITIKVDALRFIGSWLKISQESEEYISITFVLSGHCSKDAVDSYILVTRQVCGAILSLEKSSGFLREQLGIIQRIHESIDIDQSEGVISGNITPFETCLSKFSVIQFHSGLFLFRRIINASNTTKHL